MYKQNEEGTLILHPPNKTLRRPRIRQYMKVSATVKCLNALYHDKGSEAIQIRFGTGTRQIMGGSGQEEGTSSTASSKMTGCM